ncbi:MAG: hypothetical protein PHU07_06595 [Acidocella sp.]|nr:hypothetical protein [Acidocella sp.]
MIIRPFTFITGLLFVLSGAYLFVVKHRSQMLDQQLAQTAEATRQGEQSIRVLQAQWALEADPSRLAALAAQFTGLQPMKPGQLMTLADLGAQLPAPGSAAPVPNPEAPKPAMPVLAQAAPAPAPAAPKPAPVQVATATQDATPARVVAPAVKHRVPQPQRMANVETVLHNLPARHETAERHDAGASHVYFASASQPQPQPVQRELVRPMGAQVMTVRAVAASAPVVQMDNGGSMLGMAQGGSAN